MWARSMDNIERAVETMHQVMKLERDSDASAKSVETGDLLSKRLRFVWLVSLSMNAEDSTTRC